MVHAARNFEEPPKKKKSAPKPEGHPGSGMTPITSEMVAKSGHKRKKLPGVELIDDGVLSGSIDAKGEDRAIPSEERVDVSGLEAQARAEHVAAIAERTERQAPRDAVKEIQALRKEQEGLQAWFDGEMNRAEEKGGPLGERIRELTLSDKKAARLREASERIGTLMEFVGGEAGYEKIADKLDLEEMYASQRKFVAAEREKAQEEQARQVISDVGVMVTESEVGARAAELKKTGRLPKDFDVDAYERLELETESLGMAREQVAGSFWSRLANRKRLREIDDRLEAIKIKLEPMREQVMMQNVGEAVGKESKRKEGQAVTETWKRVRETGDATDKLKSEGYAPKSKQGAVAWELFQDARLQGDFDVVTYDRLETEVDRLQEQEAELGKGGFWSRLANGGRLSDIRKRIHEISGKLQFMRDDIYKASSERRREEQE